MIPLPDGVLGTRLGKEGEMWRRGDMSMTGKWQWDEGMREMGRRTEEAGLTRILGRHWRGHSVMLILIYCIRNSRVHVLDTCYRSNYLTERYLPSFRFDSFITLDMSARSAYGVASQGTCPLLIFHVVLSQLKTHPA